jgi:hypothetical protein
MASGRAAFAKAARVSDVPEEAIMSDTREPRLPGAYTGFCGSVSDLQTIRLLGTWRINHLPRWRRSAPPGTAHAPPDSID